MTPRHTPAGPLASARAAADLTGIPHPELDDLIRRGVVRTERIGGKLYVDLDDAERAVRATREGGAG